MDLILPYKIGDVAETKTFLDGYRGAWFRCKIHNMRVSESGYLECYLEYVDYPPEDKEWIRLFQNNPACSNKKSSEQIMIRPCFPQWYWKDQIPGQFSDDDVIATVYETWKVGDLVDWLSEGCYWSAKITKLINEDKVEAKGKSWHVVHMIHHKSESETSESVEETASGDEDNEEGCGGGGRGDVQQSVSGTSTISQEAPGSPAQKPSSTAVNISSLNAQKDTTLTPMENSKPGSTSKSPDPSNGMQVAVTSRQPGTGSSVKQEEEHEVDDVPDEHLEKLDEMEGRLKQLLQLSRSERARRDAVLASCHGSSKDAPGKEDMN